MPKMTHWNRPEPIEVSPEKAAVYRAQGWVTANEPRQKVQPAIVRETAEESQAPAPKKVAAKKTAKKATKKS